MVPDLFVGDICNVDDVVDDVDIDGNIGRAFFSVGWLDLFVLQT